MKKKIVVMVMLLSTVLLCVGCPFHGASEHRRAHRKAIDRDFTEIHKFVDKHVWNYDWDDPYYN